MLTTKTIEEWQICGMLLSIRPQIIQDAIFVTRQLGYRYLWGDALCIIQDSPDDKNIEIANMHNIYQNALLTISALRATTATDGFLKDFSQEFPLIKVRTKLGHDKEGAIYLRQPLQPIGAGSAVEARDWTYQEHFLSSRVLSFDLVIWWQCNEDNWLPRGCEPLFEHPSIQYRGRVRSSIDSGSDEELSVPKKSGSSSKIGWHNFN